MSHHSRSSSEIEAIALSDVLPVFLKDFMEDFNFDDVKDSVQNIFNEEEMRLILMETDDKKQILQLFWILNERDIDIDKFLRAIKLWYPWLSKMVFEECDITPSKDTKQYIEAVCMLRNGFPKHLDFNMHRMDYYWKIRKALKKIKPRNYLVVSGDLLVGKKWLTIDVCSEYTIMKAMGLNIFWLDVHMCNSKEKDLQALQTLRLLIGEHDTQINYCSSEEFDGINNKILHLQQYIRERLRHDKYKDCLLVLSDVKNSKTLNTFNLGCKILVITRNRQIVKSLPSSTTTHISINSGFTHSESVQLFEKVLQRKRNTFPKDATDEIIYQSGGQPYLLTIIANDLKLTKQRNWTDWIRNLQDLKISNNKLKTLVEISLKTLQPEEMNLYKMLAIFTHSVEIPLKVLAALWNKTERDADYVLVKFDKYFFVNRRHLSDDSVACVLPYIYRSYLKDNNDIDLIDLHRKVVSFYRVAEALEKRTEVDVLPHSSDHYLYHCIGYHMKEAGYLELFSKLYLDFGFLGKKLRLDGLPNTIGDLKYFRKEITNGDSSKDALVSRLLDFLPSIEEMLFSSKDTCLLQYALTADGLIGQEAVKQASVFRDRMWFNEKGHFHQRRQMVCLPNKPKLIELPEPDNCVIALDNNNILFVDLSLDYNNDPVYLTNNEHPIIKIKLILEDNYLITLDKKGFLKVWSITDDRRRSASRKRNSRTKVNPLNLKQNLEMLKRKCKQLIRENNKGAVQAFYIESFKNVEDLRVAFADGDIFQYSWNKNLEKFQLDRRLTLSTKVTNIRHISKLMDKYDLVLSKTGSLHIFNLRDGSQTAHSFEWQHDPNILYIAEFERNLKTHVLFVCLTKVLCLTFAEQEFEFLDGKLETVYDINNTDPGNAFTCARLSRDGCYLVLGTKRGLIIYDTENQSVVLHGNISQSIACVDIYPLDDKAFKYIVICGSENSKVLNLFALRQLKNNTIAWLHRLIPNSKTELGEDSNGPQFEPDVWLQGNKLFDLNYSDSVRLVAVDSKNRIHQLSTTDEKTWLISLPPESSRKIKAITAYNNTSYCAYDNGKIFNITQQVFEKSFTEDSITFLQLINENILVASSAKSQQCLVRRVDEAADSVEELFNIDVRKCFLIEDDYLVLVNSVGGFIVVGINRLDLVKKKTDVSDSLERSHAQLGGCDLKNNCLLLATIHFKLFIYKFSIRDGALRIKVQKLYENSSNSEENDLVTCVASSSDASLFTVGFKSGTIEVFQMNETSAKFIFRLLSHTSEIYDLKFSPNSEILVSCSEKLCFWHVSYILNNPFDSGTKQKRHSSRFFSSNSPVEDVSTIFAELDPFKDELLRNPWSNKRGPTDKPELLSCIKFVGNKAEIFYANEDFTQFNTIDNEGVYYHLCVHDISRWDSSGTNDNVHLPDTDNEVDDNVIT